MNTKLELKYKGETLKGILINETDEYIILKLPSGYNANLIKSEIKEISREKIEINNNKFSTKKETNKNLPKITILHTGGTIASKVDYRTGAVSSKFTPEELLNLFPELNRIANVNAKMITNIFSEDMRFDEYNLLLKEIETTIKQGAQGIIISHGTDTIHYTSAALQYACKNLPIPIILVGAQRSSDRASSDAFSNLDTAAQFILENINEKKQFRRIGICMHETISDNSFLILDGINARKMHSTRRDAFKQINYEPFAKIENKKISIYRENLLTEKPKNNFSYTLFNTNLKIGFFKSHPNTFAWEIDNLKTYDAIILEGTGIGNIAEHENNLKKDSKILSSLENLSKKTKVLSGVQTIYGEVSLDIYSRGRDMQKAGIIGNRSNLTTETIFCRVAFCLSQKEKKFEEIWKENLEGFNINSKDIFEN